MICLNIDCLFIRRAGSVRKSISVNYQAIEVVQILQVKSTIGDHIILDLKVILIIIVMSHINCLSIHYNVIVKEERSVF